MTATRIAIDTTGRDLVGTDLSDINGVWGELDESIKVWLGEICNPVLGTIAGGSGYTDGTYTDVPLIRDTPTTVYGGRDMLATVVISGNVVTNVTITHKGNGFATGDVLIFDDVADVGGTGADFEIPITSADASIGLIYDPDQRESNTDNQGWLFGVERPTGATGSYTYGSFFYKTTATSDRIYICNFYNWTPGSANDSYGSMDKDSDYENMWDESEGDGYSQTLTWCADADERFLCFSDDRWENPVGLFQMVRGGGNYPDLSLVSTWGRFYATSSYLYTSPLTSGGVNTAFIGSYGFQQTQNLEPQDENAVMTGHPVRTRSMYVGSLPDRIGTHLTNGRTFGTTIGTGSDEWRFNSQILVIRESA